MSRLRSPNSSPSKTPPPSDQQQLASRRAAQQFWSGTLSWEDTPGAVQEMVRKTFGIKVSHSRCACVCVCELVSLREIEIEIFVMQKLQPKYLKKYSIHTVKTEVCLCVLVCERRVCVESVCVSDCSFTLPLGRRRCGVWPTLGVRVVRL